MVRDRVEFWQALADDQGRPVTVSVPDIALPVPVAADDLADLVDVLVDNVFAHTPEPAGFEVRLDAAGGRAHLVVTDAGPGPDRPAGSGPARPGSASTSPGVRRSGAAARSRSAARPGAARRSR